MRVRVNERQREITCEKDIQREREREKEKELMQERGETERESGR